jgi:translation initiation factor 2B subunit (eIF-2B alpha/beta/delta family)
MNMMEEFMVIIELIDAGEPLESKGSKEESDEWKSAVKKAREFLKKSQIDENTLRNVMNEVKSETKPKKKETKPAKKGSLEAFGL